MIASAWLQELAQMLQEQWLSSCLGFLVLHISSMVKNLDYQLEKCQMAIDKTQFTFALAARRKGAMVHEFRYLGAEIERHLVLPLVNLGYLFRIPGATTQSKRRKMMQTLL